MAYAQNEEPRREGDDHATERPHLAGGISLTEPGPPPEPEAGWLFLRPDLVPEPWRSRSREVRLVPLLPGEAARLLEERSGIPAFDRDEIQFVRLVARGLSARVISRELGLSHRSVERRLAGLRKRFDLASSAELAAFLSEKGFR